jgi:hypothetical protein
VGRSIRGRQSGERIAVIDVLRNKIHSLIRTKTKYLLAKVAITPSEHENSSGNDE